MTNRHVSAFALALAVVTQGTASAAAEISPADPALRYFGRFDMTDPAKPRCDWPGTGIQAVFTGPSVSVKLSGGANDFTVVIDGTVRPKLVMEAGKTEYPLATGLAPGQHTLELFKRTEAHYGIVAFEGLVLADGNSLVTPPARPSRRILYVGDSFTVGYGADATTLTCASLRPYDNNWLAFGPVTARALEAEYSVQAISGLGMIHNYNDPSPQSAEPFPFFFDRTLAGSALPAWNFASWIPHLVVVALGTNDFSTATKPTQAQYATAYKAFLARLRGHFPTAEILLVSYAADTFQKPYVDAIAAEAKTQGDARVHRLHMPALNQQTDLGCDWHPNVSGHRKFADALIPEARRLLGVTGVREPPIRKSGAGAGKSRLAWMPLFGSPGGEISDAQGRLWP